MIPYKNKYFGHNINIELFIGSSVLETIMLCKVIEMILRNRLHIMKNHFYGYPGIRINREDPR